MGRNENVVGWYHSHPGYGCWLSGIDVSTQMLNQQFQEPWLAVVVDPVRTMASGGHLNEFEFRSVSARFVLRQLDLGVYVVWCLAGCGGPSEDHHGIICRVFESCTDPKG